MCKNDQHPKQVTWEEVKKHTTKGDRWIVVSGEVYNISTWAYRHPGGSKVISHYAGQDASEAFRAFHNDTDFVKKFMKPLHIGSLKDEHKEEEIKKDFEELRQTAFKMGLFKASKTFFTLTLLHIILMDVLAYLVLWYYGAGWIPTIISILLNTTLQAQISWLQHDFGHLSVFRTSKWDHLLHYFTMGFIKGASPDWWKHMHYQHHAKPNVMDKDPDVRLELLFVVGENMPAEIAKSKKNSMPYNWQHRYFHIIGPPLLFPGYFQFMVFRHAIKRKLWLDLLVMGAYYVKIVYLYLPFFGFAGLFLFYEAFRVLESCWFTWVTQSNHIPMEIDHDRAEPWLPLQMHATCDIEKSYFNDWFTGHLNFQIEHHLFPTMPRHNLYKIAPYVKSLCEKHGLHYQVKPLGTAFRDIIKSLHHSGELWSAAYHAYHLS